MNGPVLKNVNGQNVTARPVFRRGDLVPAYWTAIVNERTLTQTFPSAPAVFRFVAQHHPA